MLRDSLDRNVSDVRSAKLAKGWGEGEAQAGSGSEKSVRADQDKADSGGAPGELKRIDLNDSNRPVRTRKPGGVGGGQPPIPISKIQTIKKRAYGFRNKEHFKTAIYFHCGGLNLYPA